MCHRLLISGRVDRVSAAEMVDLGSVLGVVKPGQTKDYKNWSSQISQQLPC